MVFLSKTVCGAFLKTCVLQVPLLECTHIQYSTTNSRLRGWGWWSGSSRCEALISNPSIAPKKVCVGDFNGSKRPRN
jgi:hypothetical protein